MILDAPIGPASERPSLFDLKADRLEVFDVDGPELIRRIPRRDGRVAVSTVARRSWTGDLGSDFDLSWLRAKNAPATTRTLGETVRVVDLFAGCGGLTMGVREAARALGAALEVALAVEFDARAARAYEATFSDADVRVVPVEELFDGEIGAPLTEIERQVAAELGAIDVLIGGPPCQGHSDLNNHTRRDDPKNRLYLTMVRAAEVLRPRSVLIENVPGVVHAREGVVARTVSELRRLGYSVEGRVLHAAQFGVAQRRRRYCIVASLDVEPDLEMLEGSLGVPERGLGWAIADLIDSVDEGSTFDSSAKHSATNELRIRYLFDHELHELPDHQRPDCHRLKPHRYTGVYGRMWWDRPAPTLTSGFGSTGQGRFVHPRRPRTLTPHEAARVQFFPDFVSFGSAGRAALQQMIGNAVPPKLGYAIGLELLR